MAITHTRTRTGAARRARRLLAPALLTAALLASCSSTPVVEAESLEQEISAQLEEQIGTAPDDVSCPDDLVGEEGETMRCTLTAGEDELDVDVTVTSVDGEDVYYQFEVGEEIR